MMNPSSADTATLATLIEMMTSGKVTLLVVQPTNGVEAAPLVDERAVERRQRVGTRMDRGRQDDRATGQQEAPVNGSKPYTGTSTRPATRAWVQGAVHRYKTTLHHKASVDKLGLAPVQAQVMRLLHANYTGGLTHKELMAKGNLPHGSVSSTLGALRDKALVKAEAIESRQPEQQPVEVHG